MISFHHQEVFQIDDPSPRPLSHLTLPPAYERVQWQKLELALSSGPPWFGVGLDV
jgi:hypothetical protein